MLYTEQGEKLGTLPGLVNKFIGKELTENADDFEVGVSYVRNNRQGLKDIKVSVKYTGEDKNITGRITRLSLHPDAKRFITPQLLSATPSDMLHVILKNGQNFDGDDRANEIRTSVNKIANTLKDEKNKSVLLVGHSTPDGDTIGCVLGMKYALGMLDQEKNVDCLINDRTPASFNYLDGVKDIMIYDKSKLEDNEFLPEEYVENYPEFDKTKKYDVIMFMDVPTPERAMMNLKTNMDDSTKVIYVDHHPKNINGWDKQKDFTGIDLKKIEKENLLLVEDRSPSAVQVMVGITSRILPWLNKNAPIPEEHKENFEKSSKAFLTGLFTDTGGFYRDSNPKPSDEKYSWWKKPDYKTKALAKWFTEKTDGKLTANFVKNGLESSSDAVNKHEQFIKEIVKNSIVGNPSLGVQGIQLPVAEFNKLQAQVLKENPEFTFNDVRNTFKMKLKTLLNDNSNSYKDNAVAYLTCVSESGNISFSFRSKTSTNHAAILAGLFNGGGHGAAAGGHINMKDVDYNSKFSVNVNGEKETNFVKINKALQENFEIKESKMSPEEQEAKMNKIELVKAEEGSGKTINELIESEVAEIRRASEEKAALATEGKITFLSYFLDKFKNIA